jgi:sarcosine oxidase/L-pipecolate oxidase
LKLLADEVPGPALQRKDRADKTVGSETGCELHLRTGGNYDRSSTLRRKIIRDQSCFGKYSSASQCILCTGAASPALLPELSPHLWSKCWTLAHIELTEEEVKEYRNMPVVDNYELGFFFEPDPKTRWIKICNATQGYHFKTAADAKGTPYSVPRYASDHPEDGIPNEAEIAIRKFVDAILPQFSGRPLLGARICWCTDTADQHFLFGRHDKYPELLLGTGDSGHGFKFLPTIGSYIADLMEGEERGMKKEWQLREREWRKDVTRPGNVVKDLRDVGLGRRMVS